MTESLSLANLMPIQGIQINGASYDGNLGNSVASAGDVNGDGYCDFIIGAPSSNPGYTYVIYGNKTLPSSINLDNINAYGLCITGFSSGGNSGFSVSGVGDINNDGFDDIIIGTPNYSPSGIVSVVYGSSSLSNINLDDLSSTQGISLVGSGAGSESGASVSGAGDVNNDGYNDFLIGGYGYNSGEGVSYVIFGGSSISSAINLADISPPIGFSISGTPANSNNGYSVSGAGDMNGDGYADVISGVPYYLTSGAIYVIFGTDNPVNIDLSSLSSTQGFSIIGVSSGNGCGIAVSGLGDINNDGLDDIVIGDPVSEAAYIIYGSQTFPSSIYLSSLGSYGIYITGVPNGDVGRAVGGLGDINKDGFNDIIIGSPFSNSDAGESYVIYGAESLPDIINVSEFDFDGFLITGSPSSHQGIGVNGAGDINNDGYYDIVVGATNANNGAGASYLIYGAASGFVTSTPTNMPTVQPSTQPSRQPSDLPTAQPSVYPSSVPSSFPTEIPTGQPNAYPSSLPSAFPTGSPTEPRVIINNNNYQNTNLLNTILSSVGSLISAVALYFGPNIILNNWGYKYKFVYKASEELKDNEIGILFNEGKLQALHKKEIYLIEVDNGNNGGISDGLYKFILRTLNSELSGDVLTKFKYVHSELDRNNLKEGELGLEYRQDKTASYLFCSKKELVAIKKSPLQNVIEEYIVRIDEKQRDGISSKLYSAVTNEYQLLSNSPLLPSEQNQLRDFLLTKERIHHNGYISILPIYTDLGYIQGFIYSCCLMVKKYQHSTHKRISDDSFLKVYSVLEKQVQSVDEVRWISMEASSTNTQTNNDYHTLNPILKDNKDIESALDAVHQKPSLLCVAAPMDSEYVITEQDGAIGNNPIIELFNKKYSFQSSDKPTDRPNSQPTYITESGDNFKDKVLTHNAKLTVESGQKPGLSCIDASMDLEYIKMQDKAFAEFGEHLMVAAKDLSNLFGNGVGELQKLLSSDSSAGSNALEKYQEPTSKQQEFSTSNHLMLSLFSARQFIEYLPIIKHVTQGTIYYLGYNATIPEILDNKPFLFAMHLVAGHVGAMLLPQEAMNNGVLVSTAGSLSYGTRLVASNYLNEQRQEVLSQDKPMDAYGITKYCASTMLAYTIPSLVTCAITNFMLPGTLCSVTGYDLVISASLSSSECYSVYKTATQDDHKTTADIVMPYIADAVAAYALSGYFGIDATSSTALMMSIKQGMAITSSVVVIDYMTKGAVDLVPDEIKETYVDPIFDYAHNVISDLGTYMIDGSNALMGYLNANDLVQEV